MTTPTAPSDVPAEGEGGGEVVMEVPQGRFVLPSTSQRGRGTLRAWDAADELVLHHVAETGVELVGLRALVVGDRAGGLAIPLAAAGADVASLSDSWLAHRALGDNLAANGMAADAVRVVPLGLGWRAGDDGPYDLVVVKVPREVAVLEDVLRRVRPGLGPDTVMIGAGMTRHVHTSTTEAFAAAVGPTATSLARKKARLVLATVDDGLDPGPPGAPDTYTLPGGQQVTSPTGVFSAGRLDPGTALLLAHLPVPEPGDEVVDLGCGDGVVGLSLALAQPEIRVTFVDESYTAVQAARQTVQANLPGRGDRFEVGDGLSGVADASVDLVVVNPPFHDDHAQGDQIAWDMFTDARRALRPGGRLLVVGNRHLAHHAKLGRLFGGSTVVGSDRRFVVLSATRRGSAP